MDIQKLLISNNFQLHDITTWTNSFILTFSLAILLGLEILAHLVPYVFKNTKNEEIEIQGKHLDQFEMIDLLYININKILTVIFVYHVIATCYYTDSIALKYEELSIGNTLGSLIGKCTPIDYNIDY